jgi:GntR family histidine utilization transcriptional repressor
MDATARYQVVKRHILDRIATGELPSGARIPSENELVAALGISRMTVNRAVRELAQEGRVVRLAGVGSFVAEGGASEAVQTTAMPSIRDRIAAEGSTHGWQVIERATFAARPELARLYGLAPGTQLGFALIRHTRDEEPIQVEERYVNLGAVPGFADADLSATLPDDLLSKAIADGKTRVTIEAQPASGSIAWLLGGQTGDANLLVVKRLETNGTVASVARLFHPAGFQLETAAE